MNIGIDIDGVLTDLERVTIDYGVKMCIEENWPINLNVNKYWAKEVFNWTEEQVRKFWNRNLVKYVSESSSREFAKDIIEKLQQEGHEIYIITARNGSDLPEEYYGKMQELTKTWLEKQNIKYKKIIFASNKEKLSQCIENNIDIMIEDCPDNILEISNKIKVIKYDCQYNKEINGENIITAYSWYHIYKIIKEMKGE